MWLRQAAIGTTLAGLISVTTVGQKSAAPQSLFSAYDVVDVSIEAPFDELFSAADDNPDYSIKGVVSYADKASGKQIVIEDVDVSVRGRTSKRESECSFPKLKLRFDASDALDSSVFRGMKAVKIGTHCGETSGDELTTRFGRLANEKSPVREAFVYRLFDVVGVSSLAARPARITYITSDRKVTRNAFFLEDDREAMKRLGGTREIEPEQFDSADRHFSADDSAKLAFAEGMIGNFDWCLKFSADDKYRCDARRLLWNIFAFDRDGRAFPVMYDFDIAGMVAGSHRWFSRVYYDGFVPSKSAAQIEVLSQVQRTRSLFPRAVLDRTRRGFIDRKAAAFPALGATHLDAQGRSIIEAYLKSFFDAIERDDVFYGPVVARPGVRIYVDAEKTRDACGANDTVPVGTPVGAPLRTSGEMVQVNVLDALWHWAPPARCDAVVSGPVWIERGAISADYPRP